MHLNPLILSILVVGIYPIVSGQSSRGQEILIERPHNFDSPNDQIPLSSSEIEMLEIKQGDEVCFNTGFTGAGITDDYVCREPGNLDVPVNHTWITWAFENGPKKCGTQDCKCQYNESGKIRQYPHKYRNAEGNFHDAGKLCEMPVKYKNWGCSPNGPPGPLRIVYQYDVQGIFQFVGVMFHANKKENCPARHQKPGCFIECVKTA